MPNTRGKDEALLKAINNELDQSCDRLDGATLSRLNKIRHEALSKVQTKSTKFSLLPIAGFVTASIAVFLLFFVNPSPVIETPVLLFPDSSSEDLDILTTAEGIEFFENYDFYQWLEENESSA